MQHARQPPTALLRRGSRSLEPAPLVQALILCTINEGLGMSPQWRSILLPAEQGPPRPLGADRTAFSSEKICSIRRRSKISLFSNGKDTSERQKPEDTEKWVLAAAVFTVNTYALIGMNPAHVCK